MFLSYLDVTEYLFTCITIRLEGTTAFWCLKRRLPSKSFHQIKRLHVYYAYPQAFSQWKLENEFPPFNKECWYETCKEIAKMQGLRHLSVTIYIISRRIHSDYEEMLLAPLKELGDAINVEVVVSWKRDRYGPAETKWPFKLGRRDVGLVGDLWLCTKNC